MANWEARMSRRIVKRIVVTGKLILDTPAHFGSGTQDGSELIVLEDTLEKRPLLPGASIAGALRHYLLNREAGYLAPEEKNYLAVQLFGTALDDKETGYQSRVRVDDALGAGNMTVRDGVKIDPKTRTADEGALFSVQVWEPGTSFDLCFELVLQEGDNVTEYEEAFAAALQALDNGDIRMGARKHRGYGRCHVEDWHISEYDLSKSVHFISWIHNESIDNSAETYLRNATDFVDKRVSVEMDARMTICDSMLIREASDVAEVAHLTSAGTPVVSGTTIAGALRARALRILNTIQYPDARDMVDDLFGKHGEEGESDSLTASRLIVDEYPIRHGKLNLIQNRVKIDRLTGGAFETALFDEQPVFADDNTTVRIRLLLRYPYEETFHRDLKAQTGLLLLLLKDLATGDLPLGGESSIGRGRLKGGDATITIRNANKKLQKIYIHDNQIDTDNINDLQAYVKVLRKGISV